MTTNSDREAYPHGGHGPSAREAYPSIYEQSRRYFFYHKDGLLDIFIGLGIMMAGLSLWAGMFWMAGGWVAIFVPLWISARKSITFRRAADADALPEQDNRYPLVMAVMIGLVLVGVLVGVFFSLGSTNLPSLRAWLSEYFHLAVGLGIALLLMITAAVMRIPRFTIYAGLAVAVFAAGQWLGWVFWVGMSVSGGLMALLGSAVLIRFIRQHPVIRE
jgi:MFS family permease